MVVLGSSHAVMYSRLIDDICRRLGLPVAFFVAPATAVFFPTQVGIKMRTIEQAQSFDRARRKWLDEWHPDVIVVADRWDRHFEKPGQFERELRGLAAELAPRAKHVILLSQVPVLRLGAHENLREYVTWWLRRTGSLPAIGADSQEPQRRAADATMAAVAREFPNLQVLRADQPFEKDDGSVRYSQGRKFFYADDNHLSDAGAEVVRDLCTRAIMAGVR